MCIIYAWATAKGFGVDGVLDNEPPLVYARIGVDGVSVDDREVVSEALTFNADTSCG